MEQVEQTAKRYKTISESTAFMVMLTLLSGYLNAYTYATRGGIFANMHTGNMSKLGISLAGGNFAGSWQYLAPILAALLGVMFSELVRHRFSGIAFGSWQKNMLAFEILVLVGAAFIASGWHDMLIACVFSFVTEAQLSVFGKWEGKGHSTTICTGNLRNLGQYLYPAIAVHDRESLRTAGLYFVMVFSFALGEEGLRQLGRVSERFLTTQLDRGFRTLDFYKNLAFPIPGLSPAAGGNDQQENRSV